MCRSEDRRAAFASILRNTRTNKSKKLRGGSLPSSSARDTSALVKTFLARTSAQVSARWLGWRTRTTASTLAALTIWLALPASRFLKEEFTDGGKQRGVVFSTEFEKRSNMSKT